MMIFIPTPLNGSLLGISLAEKKALIQRMPLWAGALAYTRAVSVIRAAAWVIFLY